MTLFRTKKRLFRLPGTAGRRMNTGLFRLFRRFYLNARIRERVFHARAPQKDFSRVHIKIDGTAGTARHGKGFFRNRQPEPPEQIRNKTP